MGSDTLRERVLMAFAMASGLGILPDEEGGPWDEDITNGMDAAIALVRAEVLEEAARVADAENSDWDDYPTFATGWASAAEKIAAAIRALKNPA